MEDFTSIIGFVVTAIIYLAVWAFKSKNKAKRVMPSVANTNFQNKKRSSFNDIQAEIEKLLNPEVNKPRKKAEFVEELKVEGIENVPDKNKIQFAENYVKEGSAYKEEEIEENQILEDFDIRKAVIYSEIMERKHF